MLRACRELKAEAWLLLNWKDKAIAFGNSDTGVKIVVVVGERMVQRGPPQIQDFTFFFFISYPPGPLASGQRGTN